VPSEAVIRTGERSVVILAEREGMFRAVDVEVGMESGDSTEVRKGLKAGDRVVVVHHFPCMECTPCRDGNETACEAMHEKHIEPGGFSQYIRVFEQCVANGLYRLPDTMTYGQGSFVEPLACVVRGMRKVAPVAERTVLVFGSGLAGLLHIKLARHLGAKRITAVDTAGALFPRGTPVELDVHIQGQEVWLGEEKHTGHAASAKAVLPYRSIKRRKYQLPMVRLASGFVNRAAKFGRPSSLAAHPAVSGINCIRPTAPAEDLEVRLNLLSS